MTEQLTYFTVVCDLRALVADGIVDSDSDVDSVPVSATVTFKPLIASGDIILATNADPRPTGFVGAPVVATIGGTDGRLKLRSTPADGYPYTPVRLLASSPVLELTEPLAYSVTFSDVKWNNGTQFGSIKGFVFEAPDADVELNLITVARAPGQQATGITKIAPTGVRFTSNSMIFSFAGDDLPEPLPLADITGPQGDAATVTVGDVTTVAYDQPAAVTNTGTSGAAVLDFSIPEGEPATVGVGDVTTVAPADPATVTNTGTARNAVFDFEIPQGTAATVAVGDVTAVAPGSPATVTNTGTTADAVFDFEIPQGAAATIAVGTVATGTAGSSASVTNTGTTADAVFDFDIPRGDKGDAATIAVGDVTTLTPGSSATVTNAGDSAAAILDFGLPRGDVGAQGPQGAQGVQGIPGVSLDIEGTVATASALPSAPPAGTAYVVADVGLLFYFDGTGWSDGVSFVGPAGPTGAQGIQGPVGPVGASGGTGGVGATGPVGATGSTGPTGPAGQAANILGELASYSALPGTANDGDAYLLPTGKLYIYDSVSGWPADGFGVQFVGPVGATGPTGASGAQGEVGLTGGSGAQGEIGLTGATGAQGEVGPTGATGGTGGVGATGAPGTTTWSGITDKPAVIAAGVDAAAARTAIAAEYTGNRGVADGYAALDSLGLVPSSQLPSFVDDVIEAANLAAFPASGSAGKIYTALDTGKIYRWGGTTYVEISASPGSTDAVPEGSSNLYYTAARADGRIGAAVGSSVQAYSPTLDTYSGKSAPTGAVVGTTDAQALTNKDLTAGTNTFPTLNQDTTGSAARLTTARTINGVSFDGTANIVVPAGIQRVVQTITAPTTLGSAANTDYVYFLSSSGALNDLSFSSVVALLRGDGANNATTITDSSNLAANWTAGGNVKLSTGTKKFGTASISFDGGASSYLTPTGAASNYAFGTSDFTIEFWFNASVTTDFALYSGRTSANGAWPLVYTLNRKLQLYVNGADIIAGVTTVSTGTWHHFALCRSGTSTRMFLNGTQEGSTWTGDTNNYLNSTSQPRIGSDAPGVPSFTGFMDDVRITKGVARYTGTFTPPTESSVDAPTLTVGTPTLPTAVSNTNQYTLKNTTSSPISVLSTSSQTIDGASTGQEPLYSSVVALLSGSGENGSTVITDSSPLNSPWTVTGGVKISTAQSKFGGSSIQFVNAGDRITSTAPTSNFAFGTSAFTVEAWLRFNATNVAQNVFLDQNGNDGVCWILGSDGRFNYYSQGAYRISGATVLAANTWYHVALSRSGTTSRLFIDGMIDGTWASDTLNYGSLSYLMGWSTSTFLGFANDLRITRGQARYTANFTPPTIGLATVGSLTAGSTQRLISDGSNWRTV